MKTQETGDRMQETEANTAAPRLFSLSALRGNGESAGVRCSQKCKAVFPWRFCLLLLFSLLSPVHADNSFSNIVATITITNTVGTTNGDNFRLYFGADTNGYKYTFTNVWPAAPWPTNFLGNTNVPATGFRLVAATNTHDKAATNLYVKLKVDWTNKLTITLTDSNVLTLKTYPNVLLSFTNSTGWGTITWRTNFATNNASIASSNFVAKSITLNSVTIDDWTDITAGAGQIAQVGGISTNQSLYGASLFGTTTNGQWITWTNANGGLVTSNTVTAAVMVLATNDIFSVGTNRASFGEAAAPSYSFTGDTGTGLFRLSGGNIGIASSGVSRVKINSSGVYPVTAGTSTLGDGTLTWTEVHSWNFLGLTNTAASAPAYGFDGDENTGMRSTLPDTLAFPVGGFDRVIFDPNDFHITNASAASFKIDTNGMITLHSRSNETTHIWNNSGSTALTIISNASSGVYLTIGANLGGNGMAVSGEVSAGGEFSAGGGITGVGLTNTGVSRLEDAVNMHGVLTATNAALYTATLITPSFSNGVFTASNTVTGGWAYTRTNNTGLANGNNAGVDTGSTAAEKTYLKLSGPTAAFTINGLAGGRDGRLLVLQNSTSYTLTIANDSGVDPTAANRIYTGKNADITVTNNPGFVELIYDSATSRWGVKSKSD